MLMTLNVRSIHCKNEITEKYYISAARMARDIAQLRADNVKDILDRSS